MKRPAAGRLALAGALIATFGELHPLFDQWAQSSRDALCKGLHGGYKVYADGTPVGEETDDRSGERTFTASQAGRRAAARHAVTYTAGQLAGTVMVTRAMGYRVPVRALLAGAVINGFTHAGIDRREPLLRLAGRAGKSGYIARCHAVRINGDGTPVAEAGGPGTALMELDQAAHRAIGVLAAVVTAWIATRGDE